MVLSYLIPVSVLPFLLRAVTFEQALCKSLGGTTGGLKAAVLLAEQNGVCD